MEAHRVVFKGAPFHLHANLEECSVCGSPYRQNQDKHAIIFSKTPSERYKLSPRGPGLPRFRQEVTLKAAKKPQPSCRVRLELAASPRLKAIANMFLAFWGIRQYSYIGNRNRNVGLATVGTSIIWPNRNQRGQYPIAQKRPVQAPFPPKLTQPIDRIPKQLLD